MPQTATPHFETFADVLKQLGGIDPRRVRADIPPGKGTEKDLVRLLKRSQRLYELVDGFLVEKAMGFPESFVALLLGRLLGNLVAERDLGFVVGADAAMRLMPGLVRMPDVSFIGWDRVPVRGQIPAAPIASLVPDLAVEVLSKGNTPREMERKLKEYFLAGVRLVWFVDPRARTVQTFTAPDASTTLTAADTLGGGDVLPGLSLPVKTIFENLGPVSEQQATPAGKPKGTGKQSRGKKRKAR